MGALMSVLFVLLAGWSICRSGIGWTMFANAVVGYVVYQTLRTTAAHRLARLGNGRNDRCEAGYKLLEHYEDKPFSEWPPECKRMFPECGPDRWEIGRRLLKFWLTMRRSLPTAWPEELTRLVITAPEMAAAAKDPVFANALVDELHAKPFYLWPPHYQALFPGPSRFRIHMQVLRLKRDQGRVKGAAYREGWAVEQSSRLAGWGVFFGGAWLWALPALYLVFRKLRDTGTIPAGHAWVWLLMGYAYASAMPLAWQGTIAGAYFAYVLAVHFLRWPTAAGALRAAWRAAVTRAPARP